MGILWLINSCGYIFGPAIFAAGLVALGLCLRASLKQASARAGRLAITLSLLPLALGVCGALFGLTLMWYLGELGRMRTENWLALAKVCLVGLIVTLPPLVWSLVLVRRRRGMA
jgi:hypothetical protein